MFKVSIKNFRELLECISHYAALTIGTNSNHLAKQCILVVPGLYVYVDEIFHLLQMFLFNFLKPLYTSPQTGSVNYDLTGSDTHQMTGGHTLDRHKNQGYQSHKRNDFQNISGVFMAYKVSIKNFKTLNNC